MLTLLKIMSHDKTEQRTDADMFQSNELNEIQIFDRFGKLLETMKYYDRGWDGTSNGVDMPTSDYWFKVVRQNGDVHYGHFTLKR